MLVPVSCKILLKWVGRVGGWEECWVGGWEEVIGRGWDCELGAVGKDGWVGGWGGDQVTKRLKTQNSIKREGEERPS